MESASTLNLAIDWGLERLSWGGNPINNSNLQSFHIIGTSGINALLYLHKIVAS
jgi:hypothetical protein